MKASDIDAVRFWAVRLASLRRYQKQLLGLEKLAAGNVDLYPQTVVLGDVAAYCYTSTSISLPTALLLVDKAIAEAELAVRDWGVEDPENVGAA